MARVAYNGGMAKHGKKAKRAGRRVAAGFAAALALALAVAAVAMLAANPSAVGEAAWLLGVGGGARDASSGASSGASSRSYSGISDAGFSDIGDTAMSADELLAAKEQEYKTPLIARCGDVGLRSPVSPAGLTGILFHQASYGYAIPLETDLDEADYETTADNRSMRINHALDLDQADDAWLDAEALHIWRTTDETAMDTSIDIGALPGTTVLAPVTGTVVLVKDYLLYDEMPDIEIHIQPDGHPGLDCVLIHTTDPVVKAGDRVEAGRTPLSKIRDIEAYLTDVQLGFFTPEGIGGNHVHVQVNDADYPGYREEKLAGALA